MTTIGKCGLYWCFRSANRRIGRNCAGSTIYCASRSGRWRRNPFSFCKECAGRVNTSGLVGVHDGVRPFVSQEVIARCYEQAAEKKAVVPVVNVVETVRHLCQGGRSETVPRDEYRLVQTPQVFDAELLLRAYRQPYTSDFTDDASVVEALGEPVWLTEGNRENIKITTPFDLKIAEALLCSI